MAEKRRATTFRTSKGTIVNVQYPNIYVSPAFLSTEDVTNPTELREALREERRDRLIPVILPQSSEVASLLPSIDIRGGVGTPFLAVAPGSGTIYILFTGWPLADAGTGNNRSCYIAEIGDDYQVNFSTVRRIIDMTVPPGIVAGNYGHSAPKAFWDGYNGQWLVSTTTYVSVGGVLGFRIYLWRFNSDFTTLVTYNRVSDQVVSDSGASMLKASWPSKLMTMLFSDTARVKALRIMDYTLLNPVAEEVGGERLTWNHTLPKNIIVGSQNLPWLIYKGSSDILDAVDMGELTCVIYEDQRKSGLWKLRPAWAYIHNYGSAEMPRDSGGIAAYDGIDVFLGSYDSLSVGMPHITTLPNNLRYNLFFSLFRTCRPSFKHEIWAAQIDRDALKPTSYNRFGTMSLNFMGLVAAVESSPVPTWFGTSLTVYLSATKPGTLEVLSIEDAMDMAEGIWTPIGTYQYAPSDIKDYTLECPPFTMLRFTSDVFPYNIKAWITVRR